MRRRRVARAVRTSDVTRVRAVAIAAAAAAVIATLVVLLSGPEASHPLPRPHAELACASCHDAPASGCTTCHGPHPSARAPHRDAHLACTDCHPGHAGGGIALLPDGRAIRYAPGAEVSAGTTAFRGGATMVPLVAGTACARCHARSPCVVAGANTCFDEHRPIRDAAGKLAPRAAAWDAARDAIESATPAPTPPARGTPWPGVGAGALAAMVAFVVARRRKPPPAPPPVAAPARKRLPVIDTSTCLGCYACVDACPYDVLEMNKFVAQVTRPADCCGLILCEQKCPNGSLVMQFADEPGERELAEVPGVFVVGDIGGTPLIRNALDQGARAIRAITPGGDDIVDALPRGPAKPDDLDVVIVGAGPAGLAAALEAHALGLRYVALEQATIAESIRSFPRGKLVIDPDLPNTSRLWLAEATKEELLARWTQTVREVKPNIHEGERVTSINTAHRFAMLRGPAEPDLAIAPGFTVTTNRATYTARNIVLAIGRRGTPRKLDAAIPPAWADHVHYSLADARSFAGRRVLVVGLGDVAMEAAIALSSQAGTEVTVSARASDFRRGKARNIAEMRRRAASGTLRVAWDSTVASFAPGNVTLSTGVEVPCDSVFVLIGSLPAENLLRDLGLLDPPPDSNVHP